jgi:effector-binding domain-containing protein
MTTEPAIQFHEEQYYIAIRAEVKMSDIPVVLPPLIPEVFQWMEKNNVIQTGPCFFRYLSYDSDDQLLVDVGVPTAAQAKGDGRIITGSFPAANYVTVRYTGDYKELYHVHMGLESWMKEKNIKEGSQQIDGKEYGARTEFYITDPQEVPDPAKWETDVSILLADK